MPITDQERVGKEMELRRQGLAAFVEREVQASVKAGTARIDNVRRWFTEGLDTHDLKAARALLDPLRWRLRCAGPDLGPAPQGHTWLARRFAQGRAGNCAPSQRLARSTTAACDSLLRTLGYRGD